ncbi:MAG: hypothetical protein ACE3L7_15245 [Candidatus Pristimantibacillus sp.]
MIDNWITTLLLAFGIVVAVIGVIAYLRMFHKEKERTTFHSSVDNPPPIGGTKASEEDAESPSEHTIYKP